MSNLLDYVSWRGDLSFSDSKFGEVDATIFSVLSYIDFSDLSDENGTVTFSAAQERYHELQDKESKMGLIIPKENIVKLLHACGSCRRFGTVLISDFESYTNEDEMCQFAAMTLHLSGNRMAVVFRGTDDTITGWREDFGLSYLDSIPAQLRAVDYLNKVAAKYPNERIYVCGHSKGGNLSLYVTVHCDESVETRILKAYCFDGPGLDDGTVSSERFRAIQRKLAIYVPQSSFIGIMFNSGSKYTVVNCLRKGAFQHDTFFWNVRGGQFEHLDRLSERGRANEEQFNSAMAKMSREEKRDFADTFFNVVSSTGAKTLSELTSGGGKNIGAIIRNYGGLDKRKKDMFLAIFIKMFDLGGESRLLTDGIDVFPDEPKLRMPVVTKKSKKKNKQSK